MFIDSREQFNLNLNEDSDLKDINFKSIGLNQFKNENIYLFESKEYQFLNYKIKPKIFFLINLTDNIYKISLLKVEIDELSQIIRSIDLNVKINITKQNKLFLVDRYISIKIQKKISFLKLLPDKIIYEMLKKALKEITKRFDKRLKQKINSL